jgi:hypothetical protein
MIRDDYIPLATIWMEMDGSLSYRSVIFAESYPESAFYADATAYLRYYVPTMKLNAAVLRKLSESGRCDALRHSVAPDARKCREAPKMIQSG